ncbi:MAG: hypothetical protein ACOCTN_05715 [Candidatus Natronoplasma sp.]
MEIEYEDDKISFEKELTVLDELALDFSHILQSYEVEHVFVAGYVAILFGRSRVSEDVDMMVEKISKDKFLSLWDGSEDYYCHNTSDPSEAYDEYLEKEIAIRFSKEDVVIPNVEFKFANTEQQKRVLKEKITVVLNGKILPIARIESQISYKLYLGSKKNIEDAKYLFEIFEPKLDREVLERNLKNLDVPVSRLEVLSGDEVG